MLFSFSVKQFAKLRNFTTRKKTLVTIIEFCGIQNMKVKNLKQPFILYAIVTIFDVF
jgi:hypothetical protein